jgi:hypothetical protein
LAHRLEVVVYDKAPDKYGEDKVLERFLTHLEAEREIKELGFDKAMRNNPYSVIRVMKWRLKDSKYKGTCPVCKEL